MNIILTGFMGTGKTTVGKLLSKQLSFNYIDTDTIIETKTGKTINEIFANPGEPYFRSMETQTISELTNIDNHVISTGGGMVIREQNIRILRNLGTVINLHASPETIFNRIKNNTDRPLLNKPGPMNEIKTLLAEREIFYIKCDLRINTDTLAPEQITSQIIEFINKYKK